jgi:hypothetical protein
MTENPTAPVFTPDEREAKLPVWVRQELQNLRNTVRDLHNQVQAVKGEHAGSNVQMLDKAGLGSTPLPKGSMVKFDSNWGGITVHHDTDGRVRIQGDNTLLIRLNAGNALTVELE